MPLSSNEAHKPCKGHTIATPLQENELHDYIQSVILNKQDTNEPFYVLDLGAIESLMARWTRNLPSIRPFYAVKCNPDPSLLHAMANLGSGFDCASRAEIEAVLDLGVSPDRIIFANPCKPVAHIRYAAEVGVNLTTFDSEFELFKIQKHHPDCGLLIRIKAPDDGDSKFPLGKKFGALPEETEPLLRSAQALKLRVLGVSFHIGSGARRVEAYRTAIKAAKKVFDLASSIGLPRFYLLDIGGGFTDGEQFEIAAYTIKSAIIEHLGDEPGVGLAVIAEPGRYFAESVCTLAANIFGKRARGELREYWINDGIYGSMNLRMWDEMKMNPTPFACMSNPLNATCHGERVYTSTVFGPTCDAADIVLTTRQLPELQLNDWLIFPRMGAYTKACGTNFNGFNIASIITHTHTHTPHVSKLSGSVCLIESVISN